MRKGTDIEKLKKEGFKSGIGPNAMMRWDGKPENIMQMKYAPKEGDTILYIPEKWIVQSGNGPKIKDGFIPKDENIVTYSEGKGEAKIKDRINDLPLDGIAPALTNPQTDGKLIDIEKPRPELARRIGGLLTNIPKYEAKDYGSGTIQERGVEAEQEVRQRSASIPSQTIVTKADAIKWLQEKGFRTDYLEAPLDKEDRINPTKGFKLLISNPDFQKLNSFDKARLLAQVERPMRDKAYAPEESPKGNRKTSEVDTTQDEKYIEGRPIRAVDAIRGCANSCLNCYGLGGASQGSICHGVPVEAEVTGTFSKGEILRWGEKGDPSSNWAHHNAQSDAILDRSRKQPGSESINEAEDMFVITKLQKLEGYDPSKSPNLEISVDPLFPEDMIHTIAGAKALKDTYGDKVNLVFRIRSFDSEDPDLQDSLNIAIDSAKELGARVLETKLRFKNKLILDALKMRKDSYKQVGAQSKLKQPVLKDKFKEGDWSVCDEGETGKCQNCRNCETIMFRTGGKIKDKINKLPPDNNTIKNTITKLPRGKNAE